MNGFQQVASFQQFAESAEFGMLSQLVEHGLPGSEYFGVNEDILQNKAFGDSWLAFYEGAVEWFGIQTGESVTRMLYSVREREYGNRFFLTSNRLQYMSNKDKLEAIQAFADRGLMTRNELREIMNLAPLPAPYGDQIPARGEYYNVNEGGNSNAGQNE